MIRKEVDVCSDHHASLHQAMYELMLGVKIKVQGRPSKPTDSVLILMNHRTRLDWLFLMSYQLRCGSLRHYKISLKDQLKFVPGPGRFL